jgi:hypothetical protein
MDAMTHRPASVLHVLFVPKANTHTDAVEPGLALVCYALNALSAACVPNATLAAAAAGAGAGAGAASNAVRVYGPNCTVGFCRNQL